MDPETKETVQKLTRDTPLEKQFIEWREEEREEVEAENEKNKVSSSIPSHM
jgi:hypothetical protein